MSGIKDWFRKFRYKLKHGFFSIENVCLMVMVALCLFLTCQSIIAMSRNWELTERLVTAKRQLNLLRLETETAELENIYYSSDEYQELMARKLLDKKFEGENMVVLPGNSEEAKEKYRDIVVEISEKEYSNFEKWTKMLFPNN